MITTIFYEMILWLAAIVALPRMVYNFVVYKKYRKSFLARIGLKDQKVVKSSPFVIWIHAISVGETKAAASLARELKMKFTGCQLIISSVTETGHAEAKRCMPFADQFIYLPFDFTFITSSLVKKISPNIVILCESDLWYNFLRHTKKAGAVIALVNGKLSERSMNRFRRVSFLSRKLFDLFDLIAVQNEIYKTRFIEAGAEKEKIQVTGNLKFNEEYIYLTEDEIKRWRKALGIGSDQFVLTIGSTHEGEELLFIRALKQLWIDHDIKVLLVPRHPERFKAVSQLLEKESIPFIRYSQIDHKGGFEKVVLVDTMGMLRMCYQLSDLALVGGSFTEKVGGHNILEPCWYGKPVLFGPSMYSQVDLVELVKKSGAGQQVDESNLVSAIQFYISNEDLRLNQGKKGKMLLGSLKGATESTLKAIASIVHT